MGISDSLHLALYFCEYLKISIIKSKRDFPGGAVVKNPPSNAGDTGLIPGPGRSHMPRST